MADLSALPLAALVTKRVRALGFSPVEVVRRSGYRNLAKGLRRFRSLCSGDIKGNEGLIRVLPLALELPPQVVLSALEDTQRQILEADDAAWRSAFKPHALITTAKRRPEPIWLAAVLGVENILRIDFDLDAGPITFAGQAREGLRKKFARWKSGTLPAFGRATGFVVNYSPDRAVTYDLGGNPIRMFDEAQRPYGASLRIGRRLLTDGELAAIFGRR